MQKDRVRVLLDEVHRGGVDLLHLAQRGGIAGDLRAGLARTLHREHHVVGGEGRAVVELHARPQLEAPAGGRGLLPAQGQLRHDVERLVAHHQALVDLAVHHVGQRLVLRERVHGLGVARAGPAQGLGLGSADGHQAKGHGQGPQATVHGASSAGSEGRSVGRPERPAVPDQRRPRVQCRHDHPAHPRHDLRLLRGPCRESPEEAARRERSQRQPGRRDRHRAGGRRSDHRQPDRRHRQGRLRGAAGQHRAERGGHDLRQLLGACGKGAEESARRAQRQREPGHQPGGGASCGQRGPARAIAGRRAGSRLWRASGARRCPCRRPLLDRRPPGCSRCAAERAAGAAHAGRPAGPALDAAGAVAVPAGRAGAVHLRRALLQGRLGGPARGQCQHGRAGGPGHRRRLWPFAGHVVARTRWHAAFVFRKCGRGHHPGALRQVDGGARQAPHAGRVGRAASPAPHHRPGAPGRRGHRTAGERAATG